jgi:tetratricopeptide (TPR) repeat protein
MTSTLTNNSDLAKALARIEEHLAVDPGNRDLLASAIDKYLALGQPEDAKRHADVAITRFPDDRYFQNRLGNVMLSQGNLAGAEEIFAQLLNSAPDDNIGFNLAYAYYLQGKYGQASELLAPIVELADRPDGAVTLLMRVLHRQGELESAVALVERNLTKCGGETDFLAVASLLYFDDGQIENARQTSAAAQVGGAHPLEALIVSASLSLGDGDAARAGAQFAEAVAASPRDGRSWAGLAMVSMLKQDLTSAARQLERAVGYMPSHIGTRHLLGWCKIFNNDLAAAEEIFLQALSLDRNFGESHGGLAVVAALRGDRLKAEECIKRAVGLDPKCLSARYAAMVLSGEVKDPAKLQAIAAKALAMRSNPFVKSLAQMVGKVTSK